MRTRTLLAAAAVLITLAAISTRAEARHVRFRGAHPVAAKYGGGYCYIETPHLHVYAPDRAALYQQVDGEYVFTGDPTPFGYDGEKHTYYGHHPVVTTSIEPVYCYINGPHFHAFAAPPVPDYQMRDGVAFYVGTYPPGYAKLGRERARVVNAEYRPFVAMRPTVTVAPPPEWQGEVYVAPPAVAVRGPSASVVVNAPGVYIAPPPPPRVSITVGAPGVYVAPPPGEVVVGAPGEVVVEGGGHWRHEERRDEGHWRHEERREERREEHHDNGKHKGWGKH